MISDINEIEEYQQSIKKFWLTFKDNNIELTYR